MRTRKLFATAATGALLLSLTVAPASAADCSTGDPDGPCDTTLTLTVASTGAFTITVPNAEGLGSVDAPATASLNVRDAAVTMGQVAVNDTRTGIVRAWTVTPTASTNEAGVALCIETAADTCSTDTAEQILATAVDYAFTATVAPDALSVGATVFTNSTDLLGLSTANVAFTGVLSNEAYTVSWTPQLTFDLLATQKAGTYTGTLIHSVT